MSQRQRKQQAVLDELIELARGLDIEVRTERLLREVGYYARSGSCRLQERRLIILDRDLPVREQVQLLADELAKAVPDPTALPPNLREIVNL